MTTAPIPWKHVRHVLTLFAPLWISSAILFGGIGTTYALLREDRWSARQSLVIRDEATGAVERLGRFASRSDLKAAQEMILEMTQNPDVVAAALTQIGPPEGSQTPQWPSRQLVDQTASEHVNLVAPQGSQFGSTELVYLEVQARTPRRAEAFCRAMFDHLTDHLRQIRRVRSDSLIEELTRTRDLAEQDLAAATGRMRQIEVEFGSDLGELRNLTETISGDGTSRRSLQQITDQLREAELELQRLEQLQQVLARGATDPQSLLVSSNELLSLHPALLRMKQGLVDAQLNTRRLASIYTTEHPEFRAAESTEREIVQQLIEEAGAATEAMQPAVSLAQARVERLRSREASLIERLNRLAQVRTDYAKLDAEVRHRTEQLASAERALSEAQASRSAALSTSLLSSLGPPQVGDSPVGPSTTLLAVASIAAGLLFGLGVVFLIAPMPNGLRYGRRWSDYLQGRRASDGATPGHRNGDLPLSDAPPSNGAASPAAPGSTPSAS